MIKELLNWAFSAFKLFMLCFLIQRKKIHRDKQQVTSISLVQRETSNYAEMDKKKILSTFMFTLVELSCFKKNV